MFFKLHSEGKIGYKKLTSPDLGLQNSSHQSHIGLYDDILTFLPNQNFEDLGMFIYNNNVETLSFTFGRIQNPDGTFRSPNLKTGGRDTVSVVSVIRSTVKQFNQNTNWYLIWFGLQSEEVVFYLFNELATDFEEISNIISLDRSGRIEKNEPCFNELLNYLEIKVNKSGQKIIEELEIATQIGATEKYRTFDIKNANLLFEETGKNGEELIANYLETLKSKNEIFSYNWYNKSMETGLPYDFHLQTKEQKIIYIDVKSTKYGFERPMIFSNQEFDFIIRTPYYNIYRVYDLSEEKDVPKLKICENSKELIMQINPYLSNLKDSLVNHNVKLQNAKMSITADNNLLKFDDEVINLKKL
jgi:hypothetical protein